MLNLLLLTVLCTLGVGEQFVDCISGPSEGVRSGCVKYDSDRDDDIDLYDYAYFQKYGEPNTMAVKYVANPGNNGNTGDSVAQAYASLQYAVDAVSGIGAGPHTIYLGSGVTGANTVLSFDATNTGTTITIDGQGVGVIGNNSAVHTFELNTGYVTGTLTLQNLTINHSDTVNSWMFRNSTVAPNGVNIVVDNCTLDSNFHIIGNFTSANKVNFTFSDCSITYDSTFYSVASSNTGDFVIDNCTINADSGGGTLFQINTALGSLTIRNGSVISGKAANEIIDTGGTAKISGNVVITDSTFNHVSTADECFDMQCGGDMTITGCTFTDVGLAANNISYLHLGVAASKTLTFTGNNMDVINPTYVVNATAAGCAVLTYSNTANAVFNISDNTITTGGQGIYVANPSAAGIAVTTNNNIITLTSTAAIALDATLTDGLRIGDTTELPTNTFGVCIQNDNYIRYTGTTGGVGIRMGRTCITEGSKCLRNTVLNLTSRTGGLPYGMYSVCRNTEIAYNKIYGRSAGTIVGCNGNYVHHNTFVTPLQENKGCGAFTAHVGGSGVVDSIVTENLFLTHSISGDVDISAYYIEGVTANSQQPSNLTWNNNYYGVTGFDYGTADVHVQWIGENGATAYRTTIDDARQGWIDLGMPGNDSDSLAGDSFILVDPANGDFSVNTTGLSLLCGLGFTIGAEEYNCPTASASAGLTRHVQPGDRGTILRITPTENSTQTQWNVVQSGFSGGAYYTTYSTGESSGSPNVLGASLSYLSLWLPPYHSYTVRYREYIDGTWTGWSEYFYFQSRGPLTSFEKFFALNSGTQTLVNGVDLTPVVPSEVDPTLNVDMDPTS